VSRRREPKLQFPVLRLATGISRLLPATAFAGAGVVLACVFALPAGRVQAATSSTGQGVSHHSHAAVYGGASRAAGQVRVLRRRRDAPHCGEGVSDYHVVATYTMERYPLGSHQYRPSTLYCGNSKFGYRHLERHIGQYFGGWGAFDFSITQTLKAPEDIEYERRNDIYVHTGPIYQCFPGYYVIWKFFVVTENDQSAKIITAYGSKIRTVNQNCPRPPVPGRGHSSRAHDASGWHRPAGQRVHRRLARV
jgi:hypothetical protein